MGVSQKKKTAAGRVTDFIEGIVCTVYLPTGSWLLYSEIFLIVEVHHVVYEFND